jgi:CheY-like chemotaxis protein
LVDDLVAETVVLLGRSLPANIVIKLEPPETPCLVNVDPGQMENTLVNLAINARDAMPNGGRLYFSIRSRSLEDGDPIYDECPPPGDYVEFRVRDTGHGFGEEAKNRAFEPFYTTKSGGAGSGLGLSMVYGFVKQSGGYICLANAPEQGAEVCILLARVRDTTSAVAQPNQERPREQDTDNAWQGRLALLVEDDADVRQVLRNDLMKLGFVVLEAASGQEARPLLENVEDLYVMVSDVIMPGEIDGLELARMATQLDRRVRVVLMTGFTDHQAIGAMEMRNIPCHLLRKPFGREDLREAIKDSESEQDVSISN